MKDIYEQIFTLNGKLFRDRMKDLDVYDICRVDKKGCGETKHISEFGHRPRHRNGLDSADKDTVCLACMTMNRKIREAANAVYAVMSVEEKRAAGIRLNMQPPIVHTWPT